MRKNGGKFMTLYDFVKCNDADVWDDVYDACVTVCLSDNVEDNYDLFCCEICKKVKPISVTENGDVVAGWSKLIMNNMEKFRTFSKEYWRHQYDDDDDFIYEWINEIHAYMAGYVTESFYSKLVEFVKTLN